MDQKCQECGEGFKGRSDKKFCSDLCRNAYNNRQNSDTSNYVRNVNNILRKNRRLLAAVLEGKMTKLPKQKLAEKGFNFSYHTHIYITQKGSTYFFCYEYGYLPIDNDYYLLVKRKVDD